VGKFLVPPISAQKTTVSDTVGARKKSKHQKQDEEAKTTFGPFFKAFAAVEAGVNARIGMISPKIKSPRTSFLYVL